jgi:hypothetical protein
MDGLPVLLRSFIVTMLAASTGCFRGELVDAGPGPTPVSCATSDGGAVSAHQTYATGETIVMLANGQTQPYVLAVDTTNVYWAAYGDNTIMKVAVGGGVPSTLATALRPAGIAVDATNLYWAGGPYKLALSGGTPELLSSALSNDSIAVGPAGVVGTGYGTATADALLSVPLTGGNVQTLAGPIGIGGQNTYGIALDATNAYWSCFAGDCPVLKTPLGGGTSTTLATGHVVFGVAVDAENVYWAEMSNGAIMTVPVRGGSPETLASGLAGPNQIAMDECNLYVTTGTQASGASGSIVKVAKNGGAVTVLATGQDQPSGVAVDSTSVYWTTLAGNAPHAGTIMRVTPK